jgi:hypothetical protein
VSYLNCPACHLSIRSVRFDREHCPRCLRRDDARVPMFPSPLPYRLLQGAPAPRRVRSSIFEDSSERILYGHDEPEPSAG